LAELAAEHQIADVASLDPKRSGRPYAWPGCRAAPCPEARWLTLHAEVDDFHAGIPLADVQRAVLIYRLHGGPLPVKAGRTFSLSHS
jgi:hypothetical protein